MVFDKNTDLATGVARELARAIARAAGTVLNKHRPGWQYAATETAERFGLDAETTRELAKLYQAVEGG